MIPILLLQKQDSMIIPAFLEVALFILVNINILNPLSLKYQLTLPSESPKQMVISSHAISLEKRYSNAFVNEVFKDNILLNVAYMEGEINKDSPVNWSRIIKPFSYQFTLKPNEIFAFHEDVLPEFQGKVTKTTNAHFNAQEYFKSDGYLAGDGVCHLASLIYWAAKSAGLDTLAPTNHDFMPIPQIPREFGVSIYSYPEKASANASQNLYITNNKENAVVFRFDYDGRNLKVSVLQDKKSRRQGLYNQ